MADAKKDKLQIRKMPMRMALRYGYRITTFG